MIVQAIDNVKYNNQKIKQVNKNGNQKGETNPIKTEYSNGIYGKAQVGLNRKNNPSFGVFWDTTLGVVLESLGLSIASTALMFAFGTATFYIFELPDTMREKEAKKLYKLREEEITNIQNKMNLSREHAEKYHDRFLKMALIEPKNDGHEIGLNAVMGYIPEKYKLGIDFIVPVLMKKQRQTYTRMPNGMLLYGPPGGGKTYMAEKTCEHLKHFGVNIIKVELNERGHAKNAEKIKRAFQDGKEYFERTGNPSVIYFPQDIDNYLIDRVKAPEYIKEVRAMINSSENCASKGVTWIGTANNSQNIDPAILRPGRTDIKLPVGEMANFAIADMLKYVLYKIDEKDSAEEFDFQKVVNKLKEDEISFTPAEIELFVTDAKRHNPHPENFLTADLVIEEIENYKTRYAPTLTPEVLKRFKEDQEYIKDLDQKTLEEAKKKVKKAEDKKDRLATQAKKADEVAKEINSDLEKAQQEELQAKEDEYNIGLSITNQNDNPTN